MVTEFGSTNYGNQLIDFFDIDINKIIRLSKNIEQMSGDDVTKAISDLVNNNPALFLVELMTHNDEMKAYGSLSKHSYDEYKICDNEYKNMVLNTLKSVVSTYKEFWALADYYCICNRNVKEKFDFIHAVEQSVTDMTVEEIISARKPGKDFFLRPNENDYSFPYTHAYRFSDLKNYIQFIFLNMMQYNPTFSKCNYCYNFFMPKTKKLTRFCDKVDPVSGKTCKEIAPTAFRNHDLGSTKIMQEYNRSLQRNYKRMCRAEERLTDKQSDKDIEPQVYNEWRDRVLEAMRLWKSKKISDDEFLKIVRELD
ncbi:MAG: hypothetical protein HDT46_01075 [Ruminococcaceae bacterium]|nr:hypothetical protein [Oscillospiraceae bacterium]